MKHQGQLYLTIRNMLLKKALPVAVALCLSSCSLFSSDTKPADETADPGVEIKSSVDKPENELLQAAKKNFRSGLYSVSRESFQALREGYPLGAYAEFAELKIADTYFETSEFDTAAPLYEEFANSHPASNAAPYALVRAARSYQLSNRGVGRDVTSLKKSVELYDKLFKLYPSNVYKASAIEFRTDAVSKLAAHEREVIEYYRNKDKTKAISAREAAFKKEWGKDPLDMPEYKEIDEEEIEIYDDPSDNESTVAVTPPKESPAIQPVKALEAKRLPSADKATAVNSVSSLSQTSPAADSAANILVPVTQIECSSEKNMVIIHLGRKLPNNFDVNQIISTFSGKGYMIRIPNLTTVSGVKIVQNCFRYNDLELNPDGTMKLNTQQPHVQFLDLDNPPRLIITVGQQ